MGLSRGFASWIWRHACFTHKFGKSSHTICFGSNAKMPLYRVCDVLTSIPIYHSKEEEETTKNSFKDPPMPAHALKNKLQFNINCYAKHFNSCPKEQCENATVWLLDWANKKKHTRSNSVFVQICVFHANRTHFKIRLGILCTPLLLCLYFGAGRIYSMFQFSLADLRVSLSNRYCFVLCSNFTM